MTLDRCPSKPAAELLRLIAADKPKVSLVPAHPIDSSNGLNTMPPPIPVNPDSSPIPTPSSKAIDRGGGLGRAEVLARLRSQSR